MNSLSNSFVMREGEIWFLVSLPWWLHWIKYTGVLSSSFSSSFLFFFSLFLLSSFSFLFFSLLSIPFLAFFSPSLKISLKISSFLSFFSHLSPLFPLSFRLSFLSLFPSLSMKTPEEEYID